MGREASITYDQVAAIADRMKTEGVKPTLRAVRERLGGSGSMGTINKLLQQWRSSQERRIDAALMLPPALQHAILDFMDQEVTVAKAALEGDLAEQQQYKMDLLVCGLPAKSRGRLAQRLGVGDLSPVGDARGSPPTMAWVTPIVAPLGSVA